MKLATVLFVPALCGTSLFSSEAATQWAPSGGRIDEVVADTTMAAPPLPLQPLGAPIPFASFRYPHVDDRGNVTFIADDPVYGSDANHGIYRSHAGDGKLVALATNQTPIPGSSARFTYIRGLQMEDNGRDFVFKGNDSAEGSGIYLWREGGLLPVARVGETTLPGVNGPLTDVEYAAASAGRVLYVGQTAEASHLVLFDIATQSARVLVSTGDPIPGASPAEAFRYFSPQNWLSGAEVVFRAARVATPHRREFRTGSHRGIYGWTAAGAKNYALGELRAFVDWTTPAPGQDGRFFTDLRSAPVNEGLIAFIGSGDGFRGVYCLETANAKIKPVVDTATNLDGRFAGPFEDFGKYVSIVGGDVVFVGSAAGNYEGVFLYRPGSDELLLLTDNRAPVEGKRIRTFEVAGRCLINGRLAVAATFEDKSAGVYLATIPRDGLRRMADQTPIEP